MAPTIYLHWTATGYDWIRPGHYHSIVGGDGRVHRLHDYSVDLPAHTWRRNINSVALACACMGGQPDPWLQPPTVEQLSSLCAEAASLARRWGWGEADITIQRVMTHAEAASNRDGQIRHDNYGPVVWGGTGERWDLLQLEPDAGIDVVPTYRVDGVQASIGWPLVELSLQSSRAPVILTGILRPSEQGDRAWCRVVEFAEEFGISIRFDPLVLGERRGG